MSYSEHSSPSKITMEVRTLEKNGKSAGIPEDKKQNLHSKSDMDLAADIHISNPTTKHKKSPVQKIVSLFKKKKRIAPLVTQTSMSRWDDTSKDNFIKYYGHSNSNDEISTTASPSFCPNVDKISLPAGSTDRKLKRFKHELADNTIGFGETSQPIRSVSTSGISSMGEDSLVRTKKLTRVANNTNERSWSSGSSISSAGVEESPMPGVIKLDREIKVITSSRSSIASGSPKLTVHVEANQNTKSLDSAAILSELKETSRSSPHLLDDFNASPEISSKTHSAFQIQPGFHSENQSKTPISNETVCKVVNSTDSRIKNFQMGEGSPKKIKIPRYSHNKANLFRVSQFDGHSSRRTKTGEILSFKSEKIIIPDHAIFKTSAQMDVLGSPPKNTNTTTLATVKTSPPSKHVKYRAFGEFQSLQGAAGRDYRSKEMLESPALSLSPNFNSEGRSLSPEDLSPRSLSPNFAPDLQEIPSVSWKLDAGKNTYLDVQGDRNFDEGWKLMKLELEEAELQRKTLKLYNKPNIDSDDQKVQLNVIKTTSSSNSGDTGNLPLSTHKILTDNTDSKLELKTIKTTTTSSYKEVNPGRQLRNSHLSPQPLTRILETSPKSLLKEFEEVGESILDKTTSVSPAELKKLGKSPKQDRDPNLLKNLILSEKSGDSTEDDRKIPYFLNTSSAATSSSLSAPMPIATSTHVTRSTITNLKSFDVITDHPNFPGCLEDKVKTDTDKTNDSLLSSTEVDLLIQPSEKLIQESVRQLKSLRVEIPKSSSSLPKPKPHRSPIQSTLEPDHTDISTGPLTSVVVENEEPVHGICEKETNLGECPITHRDSHDLDTQMEESTEEVRRTIKVAVDIHRTNSNVAEFDPIITSTVEKDRDLDTEEVKVNGAEVKRSLSRSGSWNKDGTDARVSMSPMHNVEESELVISSESQNDSDVAVSTDYDTGRRQSSASFSESFKHLQPFNFNPAGAAIQQQGKRERLYKVLVVGELGTGKTSIIKRYVHQFFSQHYRATIGVDFALKVLRWDPETVVRLQLWDIAGQERFGSMTRVYYKEAVGAFVVFDVTRSATLEAVPKWKADLDSKVVLPDGRPIPTVLLANKSDQPKEGIAANREKMNEFCKQQGFAAWFETSAKENIHIDESASFLVSRILEMDRWSQEPMTRDPDKLELAMNGKHNPLGKSDCAC